MASKDRAGFEGSMLTLESVSGRGQWVWSEEKRELCLQSPVKSRSKSSHIKLKPWVSAAAPNSSSAPESGTEAITLEDVKRAAVKLIDEDTVRRTRRSTCKLFDTCYKTKLMDDFLWSNMIYYQSFIKHKRALSDENIHIAGSIGDGARAELERCKKELFQNAANLGEVYSRLILGLGDMENHHLLRGRLRFSKTQTDREFFEVLHEFLVFAVWVTFGYKDWDTVQGELGRLFRTPQFNRDIKVNSSASGGGHIEVEGLGRISKSCDQYLSYKVLYDRPFVGMLKEIHTAAHKSVLPDPKDKHPGLFGMNSDPKRYEPQVLPAAWSPPDKLGIIGDSWLRYNPETLQCLESESESEGDSEEESERDEGESLVSGIIEDDGDSDDSF